MVKEILQIGAPILEQKTELVKDIHSPQTQELIQNLLDTCLHVQERSAGLSAPQIGVKQSICVCRRVDLERDKKGKEVDIKPEVLWEIFVNPKITFSSKEDSVYWEGCLSIGKTENDTLYGPVARPKRVHVEYYNREGEKKTLKADDFFAHVVQHEFDHLEGILFIGKVPRPDENIWVATDLDKYIDKHGDYPEIIY